jgi:hypothetical protein
VFTASAIAMQFEARPLFLDVSLNFGGGNRHGLMDSN